MPGKMASYSMADNLRLACGRYPEAIRVEVGKRNRATMLIFLVLLVVSLGILTAVSNKVSVVSDNGAFYAYGEVSSVLFLVVSYVATRINPKLSTGFAGLFVIVVLAFACYFSTYADPDNAGTSFCVILVATPMLFVIRPQISTLLTFVATLAFCVCAWSAKDSVLATTDTINALFYLALGTVLNINIQVVKIREITQRNFIAHERDTDGMTGLLSKHAFELQVKQYLSHEGSQGCLIIFDLDGFKWINDTWGHANGDTVISQVGECVQKSFRKSDVMGRFGGDEFIVFLPSVQDRELANHLIERLNNGLAKIELPDPNQRIQGSGGIAFANESCKDYAELFITADQDLYLVKQRKKKVQRQAMAR